ncbi:hypothetical protein VP01_1142g2 [Puccinia sorghi]|uniref:Uncharacterized protein n=1 Tax=Puccinia sorghi TaxID=27349 RepID=A0A0L6VS47_9BASI|nr:hypothetical protein VP01_1142g2 [Puccinia sorghi]
MPSNRQKKSSDKLVPAVEDPEALISLHPTRELLNLLNNHQPPIAPHLLKCHHLFCWQCNPLNCKNPTPPVQPSDRSINLLAVEWNDMINSNHPVLKPNCTSENSISSLSLSPPLIQALNQQLFLGPSTWLHTLVRNKPQNISLPLFFLFLPTFFDDQLILLLSVSGMFPSPIIFFCFLLLLFSSDTLSVSSLLHLMRNYLDMLHPGRMSTENFRYLIRQIAVQAPRQWLTCHCLSIQSSSPSRFLNHPGYSSFSHYLFLSLASVSALKHSFYSDLQPQEGHQINNQKLKLNSKNVSLYHFLLDLKMPSEISFYCIYISVSLVYFIPFFPDLLLIFETGLYQTLCYNLVVNKLSQLLSVDMQKFPSLCRLLMDCSKTSTYGNRYSVDGSLSGEGLEAKIKIVNSPIMTGVIFLSATGIIIIRWLWWGNCDILIGFPNSENIKKILCTSYDTNKCGLSYCKQNIMIRINRVVLMNTSTWEIIINVLERLNYLTRDYTKIYIFIFCYWFFPIKSTLETYSYIFESGFRNLKPKLISLPYINFPEAFLMQLNGSRQISSSSTALFHNFWCRISKYMVGNMPLIFILIFFSRKQATIGKLDQLQLIVGLDFHNYNLSALHAFSFSSIISLPYLPTPISCSCPLLFLSPVLLLSPVPVPVPRGGSSLVSEHLLHQTILRRRIPAWIYSDLTSLKALNEHEVDVGWWFHDQITFRNECVSNTQQQQNLNTKKKKGQQHLKIHQFILQSANKRKRFSIRLALVGQQ